MRNFKNIALVGVLSATILTGCLKEDENFSIGISNPETSIYTLRNLHKGSDVILTAEQLSDAKYIKGVIISNSNEKNIPQNYAVIQSTWRNQTRGILLDLESITSSNSTNKVASNRSINSSGFPYNFGDSVTISLENLTLSKHDGLLILKGLNTANIEIINKNNQVLSKPVSISALVNNFSDYESTYVDITADLETEPANATPLKGSKLLTEGDSKLSLFTSEDAIFANKPVAPSATFVGIPFIQNGEIQLRLQSYAGMTYPSGRIYTGWPETFESPEGPKGSYNMSDIQNNMGFHTGQWHLFQSIIGDTQGRDRIVSGTKAIRFQQNLAVPAYLQMNFDVPNGASKVTLWYGAYYTDRSSSFILEYSQDQGITWAKLGETISDAHKTSESLNAKQAIYLMNIQGPVRFRVTKLGLGTSSNTVENGRLGIDDISVFRSY